MEKDSKQREARPVKKISKAQFREESTDVSKVDKPANPKKKAGKRPAVRGGKPVSRKSLKGDIMRGVNVPGSINEVE